MTTGSWDPRSGTSTGAGAPGEAVLRHFVELGSSDAALNELAARLGEDERRLSHLMQLPEADWHTALAGFDERELLALVRFFTCAEMQLPGWQAGARSPVIAINRLLRQRGCRLDVAMLRWIRAHSDNRFLPNGPIEPG